MATNDFIPSREHSRDCFQGEINLIRDMPCPCRSTRFYLMMLSGRPVRPEKRRALHQGLAGWQERSREWGWNYGLCFADSLSVEFEVFGPVYVCMYVHTYVAVNSEYLGVCNTDYSKRTALRHHSLSPWPAIWKRTLHSARAWDRLSNLPAGLVI